ncbi:Aquaporin Z 2 [Nocardioides dokdonensis FR1436]|uniref:Aquaporin Z 2 n=1 Tax=Nocardioides dokdonensis FR1436 TaxID=1300347 RepID=A0A1A9GF69_9ACTN|nr:aquaporin [Nocardioides dokdonensis]ANH36716.1 Aquaporin Z 2 [Nocardioides dokdonensis FR1436]
MAETAASPTAPDPVTPSMTQRGVAEGLGTMVLVLLGGLATVLSGYSPLVTALGFGLTVTAVMLAFARLGHVHLNPAVSIGAALAGRLSWAHAGVLAAAQVLGGVLGALAGWVVLHGFATYDLGFAPSFFGEHMRGANPPGELALWSALLLELLLTGVFVWLFLAATDRRSEHASMAPLAVGLAFTAVFLATVVMTGGGINPARAIGTALFSGVDAIAQNWVFVLAPLLGAALAGLTYPMVMGADAEALPGSGFTLPRRSPAATAAVQQPDWNQAHHQSAAQPVEQGPIIQDGWQWDPVAHQWKPVEQAAPQPRYLGDDDGRTQIRP